MVLKYKNEIMTPILGINPGNATATPDKVVRGQTFYAGSTVRQTGTFDGFEVEQAIQPDGTAHLIINSVVPNQQGSLIKEQNIELMKLHDYSNALFGNGEVLSDAEYEQAELEFQAIAHDVMGV